MGIRENLDSPHVSTTDIYPFLEGKREKRLLGFWFLVSGPGPGPGV